MLYQVTFRHRGQLVRLPLLRTASQVESLKQRYEDVRVKAMPSTPSGLNEFRQAVAALTNLYRAAKARNDNVMARRVETALGALVGLSADAPADDEDDVDAALPPVLNPRRHTLHGLGPQ